MPLPEGKPEALHFGAHLVHTRFETPSAHGRGGASPSPRASSRSTSVAFSRSLTFRFLAAYNSSTLAAICRTQPRVHTIRTGPRPGLEGSMISMPWLVVPPLVAGPAPPVG